MLSGFNTNIRHRGVLFHVQSEDSGRARPHIITHLYYGGTILASEKSSYADHLDDPNLGQLVRDLKTRAEAAVTIGAGIGAGVLFIFGGLILARSQGWIR